MAVKRKIVTVEFVVPKEIANDPDDTPEKWVAREFRHLQHNLVGECKVACGAGDSVGPALFKKTQLATLVKAATEARRYLDRTPCAKTKDQVLRLLDKALK